MGTAIYIHPKVTYDKINITNNDFQISAVKLYLGNNNNFTLLNLYNQPNKNYNLNHLSNILNGFQDPFLILGDFNAHSPLWDYNCQSPDNAGNLIELLIDDKNLCCLNDNETSTFYSKIHGTLTSVDLSLCSSNIIDRYEWNASDDLYSSDHFPVIISCLENIPLPQTPRYNIHKADWELYKLHTRNIPPFQHIRDHEETDEFLTTFITNAANKSIPLSSPQPSKHTVPWWSETLSDLIKEKHSIGRRIDTLNKRFNRLKTKLSSDDRILPKLISIIIEMDVLKPLYNKLSAKFRKEVIKGRIISWKSYISSISSNTPLQKIWQKFRRISGTYSRPPRHPLLCNGQKFMILKK